jgi:bifunctional DNA-binding transcriptional regulator/antitoxin component of YhaV-PrlF toxin-antitoxin module
MIACYGTGGSVSAENPKDTIRISQRVKILKNGRMTLPIDIRDLAGVKDGQWVLVEYEEGQNEITIRLIRETED